MATRGEEEGFDARFGDRPGAHLMDLFGSGSTQVRLRFDSGSTQIPPRIDSGSTQVRLRFDARVER
eukprot:8136046-Pyramimonas_sp.AAC.1